MASTVAFSTLKAAPAKVCLVHLKASRYLNLSVCSVTCKTCGQPMCGQPTCGQLYVPSGGMIRFRPCAQTARLHTGPYSPQAIPPFSEYHSTVVQLSLIHI